MVIKELQIENEEFKVENERLQTENTGLRLELDFAKLELAKFKRLIFGQKRERHITESPSQLQLELGLEIPEPPQIEQETVIVTRTKPQKQEKQRHSRAVLPTHLPREEEVIEPENIPAGSKKIGELITEILEYKPGRIYVRKIIRPKYALPKEEGIVTAELPSLPIYKGNAGASLITHIAVNKYVDHLPLYRQAQIFKREGLTISQSTIGGWIAQITKPLEYLYEKIKSNLLKSNYLQVDEVPIPVLTKDKPGATHKGYFWVFHSPPLKMALFFYHKSRSAEAPKEILINFQGALQTDAYAGYNSFEKKQGIKMLACMAHARRKFFDAQDNDPVLAQEALVIIGKLYDIEREARENDFSTEKRKELRMQKSIVILAEFKKWLMKNLHKTLPKSPIGKAISYTLTNWNRLEKYVDNGIYEIDNNLVENKIRPVTLGRKNYLFAGSHEAAQRSAIFYSLFASCKLNDVNPYQWLTDVLNRIQETKMSEIENLLPQNWKNKNK